jgi:hypothetical protein
MRVVVVVVEVVAGLAKKGCCPDADAGGVMLFLHEQNE